ncbi:MAG: SPFH domain-containing protein [Saprospiraceae bacterium]|nr:SPFH domain-containing protein [Candidatus Vicinibacter affinis]MBK7800854.1 SPFH domain-containing protein [Candidatus Vicinibacter affinis]MBK9960889.1 SPFH domain-containing protein [Candidatus Vicinibacter affinis]
MEPTTIILFSIFILFLLFSFVTVSQGSIGVVTIFGKYQRIMSPGLNVRIPFIEQIHKRISIQNRSVELGFQAVTIDQANVNFTAMLLYSVLDQQEETIKNVAFKFFDERNFMQALIRSVEGSVRAFVAIKRQSEVLILRREIVENVKEHLDKTLEDWGYHLIDLQINDITFDEEVMRSMAKVVASNNLKAAAENEGQALLITKTKAAEAEGNFIKISAEAEKLAAQLRGQGIASFREEIAKGMSNAAKLMQDSNLDASLIMFSMWTEAVKNFAEHGQGNVIFLDGSPENMEQTIRQMLAMSKMQLNNSGKDTLS